MNNVLDLEYIDEQRLMDDMNSKDNLLVSVENDISTIERYRDMHEWAREIKQILVDAVDDCEEGSTK